MRGKANLHALNSLYDFHLKAKLPEQLLGVLQLALVLWQVYEVGSVGHLGVLATLSFPPAVLIPRLQMNCQLSPIAALVCTYGMLLAMPAQAMYTLSGLHHAHGAMSGDGLDGTESSRDVGMSPLNHAKLLLYAWPQTQDHRRWEVRQKAKRGSRGPTCCRGESEVAASCLPRLSIDTRAEVVVCVTTVSAFCSGCLPVARHDTTNTTRMQRAPALMAAPCTMLLLSAMSIR